MKQMGLILPCYAADTAGVCSALYELGGMTVVHDASGCNSTYATHDEPRWYDKHSMVYITALTETDAIMGDDARMIGDICRAAADQRPAFIALCGSPMPMMIGTDFDAAAAEIEQRSGIRTIALHTNGTRSYLEGASEAFLALVRDFVRPAKKRAGLVNLLGATPLDLDILGTVGSIRKWAENAGFTVGACMAMDDTLAHITETAAAAEVSLVLSYSGLAAAEALYRRFGIPYVCGVPVGERFSRRLAEALYETIAAGQPQYPCAERTAADAKTIVIGESIYAGSVAAELGARVICPLPHTRALLAEGDSAAFAEKDIAAELRAAVPETIVADPLYRYILPQGTRLLHLPHFAFSGRCFAQEIPDLIDTKIEEKLHD